MRPLLSNNPVLNTVTKDQLDRIEKGEWYHSIDLPNGDIIPGIVSVDALRARMDAFAVPADLRGKRVLDVGAATGWCSFEMERRGAQVIAVDCVEYDDFHIAHRLLQSRVEYRVLDVDELTPDRIGQFDIVVFFGVLYHLRHPLLGLEKLLALTREQALVESFICDAQLTPGERAESGCYMEFYEIDQLGGQIDNWVGPNVNCLLALCRTAGFVRVELKYVQDNRAGVVCHRLWECAPSGTTAPTPIIGSVANNRTGGNVFHPDKDEYISLYFRARDREAALNDIRVEIDGFGAPILTLASHGAERWQANLRRPVGLARGPHSLRLRFADSSFSSSVTFYCGEPPLVRTDGNLSPMNPPPPGFIASPMVFRVQTNSLAIAVNISVAAFTMMVASPNPTTSLSRSGITH